MKDEFTYKSTPNGKLPSGRAKKGTFRDISLSGADPRLIDEYDMECIERGLRRRELFNELLGHPDDGGDLKRFYEIFSKNRRYDKLTRNMSFSENNESKNIPKNEPQ